MLRKKLLVVDDTQDILELLKSVLTRAGYDVVTAEGGEQMDAVLAVNDIDLIILDSMMPHEDGLSICRRISASGGPPIIMLSAKAEDRDKIMGLDLGAEDYLAKPFNNDELIARIRVVLRRLQKTANKAPSDLRTFLGWTLDNQKRRLTAPNSKILALSAAEFALLTVLLDHPERPLSRSQILSEMDDLHGFSTPRGLDTLVSRLRQKLEYIDPTCATPNELIRTVHGVGYMLRPA